ncbi:MAG: hydroxymethylglutaryl-CoA lyase [Eubacteriales bacterium]|nr:hydroxymethylglutaryl-CoA lyase [Eubacteriales bacterium]
MNQVEIIEVGPRDGFQSVKAYIPLDIKLSIIDELINSGIKHLQITSFVSPKAIPQMQDAQELAAYCLQKYPNAHFMALVPNLRGAKTAWETGIRQISYVVSLSERHHVANINRTRAESFADLLNIQMQYPELEICLDLATAFGCPFEGRKHEQDVLGFIKPYVESGIRTINLCDTIGIANPAQVRKTIRAIQQVYPGLELQIHIHDTRNMGMVNTLAAIECGVTKVQSTLGGLGGCPFAPGASGNLATEDLVFMLSEMGYELGIDLPKLIEAARYQTKVIPDAIYSGHLHKISQHI